jgi:hypothetical protein
MPRGETQVFSCAVANLHEEDDNDNNKQSEPHDGEEATFMEAKEQTRLEKWRW